MASAMADQEGGGSTLLSNLFEAVYGEEGFNEVSWFYKNNSNEIHVDHIVPLDLYFVLFSKHDYDQNTAAILALIASAEPNNLRLMPGRDNSGDCNHITDEKRKVMAERGLTEPIWDDAHIQFVVTKYNALPAKIKELTE